MVDNSHLFSVLCYNGTITFSVENISILLGVVRDYTIKLAETNAYE